MSGFKYPVYAWYFPNWHQDSRNDVWHGEGWTEWEVCKHATPRFPGHQMPRKPLWGYEDESDPKVMAKKIDTALAHGIDGFMWDFYWFEDGGYRLRALEEGFFGAENNEQFKFAFMWCNHDPIYVHPASRRRDPHPLFPKGDLSLQAFYNATEYLIKNCFWRKNYIRVDGKLYFTFWNLDKLVKGFGGMEATKIALNDFRRRVRDAGLGELYLTAENRNLCYPFMKGRSMDELLSPDTDKTEVREFVHQLGVDGLLSYNWVHSWEEFPSVDYTRFRDENVARYAPFAELTDLPTNITVSVGWDSSPRTVQSEKFEKIGYPFCTTVVNNTPEAYEVALRAARDFALSDKFTGQFITLATFNEWTEGHFIEPDDLYGYGYLEAIKRVFG